MKRIKQFALSVFTLCSIFSCEEGTYTTPSEDDSVEITDNLSTLTFAYNQVEGEVVTFTASSDWTATSLENWIIVSPLAGPAGQRSITISAKENTTTDDRSAKVRIAVGTAKKDISVLQKAEGSLIISPGTLQVKSSGEIITIILTTNLDYLVKIAEESQSWISQIQSRTLNTYNLQFEIKATEDYKNREGEIVIHDKENNLSETITIFQAQKDAIIISNTNISVPEAGDEIDVVIGSNVDYVVEVPASSTWISQKTTTKILPSTTIQFTVLPNPLEIVRECKITVRNIESGLSDVLVVQQNRKDAIITSQTYSELTNDGGEVEIVLAPNIVPVVEIPLETQSWISVVTTRSTGSNNVKLGVKPNDTSSSRSANVTIKQGVNEQVFEIYQSEPELIVVSESEINVGTSDTLVYIAIRSNVDYELTLPKEPWLSLKLQPDGVSNRKIAFNVTENSGADIRAAKVIITDKTSGVPQEVHIIQASNSDIPDIPDVDYSGHIVLENSGDLVFKLGELSEKGVNLDTVSVLKISGALMLDMDFEALDMLRNLSTLDILETATETIPVKCFYLNSRIKKVILPEGLITIRADAFKGSTLETVIIPKTLMNWTRAFIGCGHLTDVVLTQGLTAISAEAFSNCPTLTTIDLPEGLIAIGPKAFYQSGLTSVKIPSSLTSWSEAFVSCSDLANVVLSEGLTTIGAEAFLLTALESITIPKSLKNWDNAFSGCTNLKSVVLTEGLTTIGAWAFSESGLTSVTIPSTITNWGGRVGVVATGYAFANCANLKSVVLTEGLTTLGDRIFAGTGIESITIPKSMMSWSNALAGCTNLTSVVLSEGLTTIGERTFAETGITSVRIPISMKNWAHAFVNCTTLKSVELPEGLTTIGAAAFDGTALTSVTIPKSMKVWYGAFVGCADLTDVILPEGLTTIGNNAFYRSGLTTITIPKSITDWDDAFYNFSGLTSVVLTEGLVAIGQKTFAGTALTSVIIPASVTNIGAGAFENCLSLGKITSLNPAPPTIDVNTFSLPYINNIYVPQNSVEAYKTDWSNFISKISKIIE